MSDENKDKTRKIRLANMRNAVRGRKTRFGYDEDKDLFFAKDGNDVHFFGNFERGCGLYKRGLKFRADALWASYTLGNIELADDDVVIDCGANYADLWLSMRGKIKPENYITFEPGTSEHRSIVENAPNARNNAVGLGKADETLKLYVNARDADSSFIEPASFSQTIETSTVTLDHYLEAQNIPAVKLFKLEAEGFEPEILEGAIKALSKIEFIAIDGGNERGKDCEQTFSFQTNLLTAHEFEMIDVNFKWGRALFRNKQV
jgi:FkbM family methyltransferase